MWCCSSPGAARWSGSAISPVIKICANPETYRRMADDMDVDAGRILEGAATLDEVGREICDLVLGLGGGAADQVGGARPPGIHPDLQELRADRAGVPAGGVMSIGRSRDRLAACYTGVVHDVMRGMGLRDFTLPPELRPILPERAMAGPAFTIEGEAVAGADAHETLLAWTGLLSQAPAGSIWVSQPNDRVVAHMGELSAETLKNKGVRGCVADGFIRDVNFLLAIGFQTWCRGFTPRDIVGHWLPRATGVPVTIGEVVIAPGDYLVGRPRRADPGAGGRGARGDRGGGGRDGDREPGQEGDPGGGRSAGGIPAVREVLTESGKWGLMA